jgi:cell division protein FtsQ
MKPIVRRGLEVLTVLACAAIWVFTTRMGQRERRTRTCQSGIQVTVLDSAVRHFVAKEDLEKWLDLDYHAYVGLPLDSVNLDRIEQLVMSRSSVRSCEAWLTDDGTLHLDISQREPVVRFDDGHNGYYADATGFIFPLQARGSAEVPVVDGKLPLKVERGFKGMPEDPAQLEWLRQVIGLVDFIKDSVWENNIKQITVDAKGDLVLTPWEGRERFIFGEPVRIKEKLLLMRSYYEAVAPSQDPGYYSTVDLRFRNQLVCRK